MISNDDLLLEVSFASSKSLLSLISLPRRRLPYVAGKVLCKTIHSMWSSSVHMEPWKGFCPCPSRAQETVWKEKVLSSQARCSHIYFFFYPTKFSPANIMTKENNKEEAHRAEGTCQALWNVLCQAPIATKKGARSLAVPHEPSREHVTLLSLSYKCPSPWLWGMPSSLMGRENYSISHFTLNQ